MLTKPRRTAASPSRPRTVPKALIYEIMDGEPIYYRGYRDVLNGKKTIEEITGASTLQSALASYIFTMMARFLDEKNPGFSATKRAFTSTTVTTWSTMSPFTKKPFSHPVKSTKNTPTSPRSSRWKSTSRPICARTATGSTYLEREGIRLSEED